MKTLKENLKTVATYASADTTNAENFPAWTPSDAALLEQLAMTGALGNSFYANAKEAAKGAVALLERVDAQALAAVIVRGRNEGFIRAFPILGLVYLSKKNAHLFRDAFKKVILTGNDLVDFIEVAKTVRGFGRSLKTAIADWIASNTNPYYAQKYRREIADAIRLSRFKGEDSIYAYILNAYSDVKGNSAEKLEKAYAEYPDLAAHRDFVAAVEAGDLASAARILDAHNLDVNSLTAYYGKFDKTLWAAVAKRSPVMRFVKYLAKFLREGVLTPALLKAKVNVEALKKAKVFPFRLYTAYLAVAQEVSAEGKWALDHLAEVMNEYAQSYDWSAGLENVTVLPWDEKVKPYRVPRADSVMTHIKAITDMVEGCTYMETAVNYMLKNGIDTDYAVFLTDTMEYGTGWLAAWKNYHKRHPKAVAFVLRGDSYMTSPIPEAEAKRLNVYQIFGWNDSVIDYMKFVLEKRKSAVA